MKNLLNNIPQEEKNRILEMHRVVKEQSVIGAPNRGMIDTGRDGVKRPINPSDYGMGKYSMTNFDKPSGVKAVQQSLIDKGYYVGKTGADGKLGDNTKKAIIKYQKDNGIKQTGLVDTITAKSLGVQPLTPTTQKKDNKSNVIKTKSDKGVGVYIDCVKNSPKKQYVKMKDGSESLLIDGHYFFKNGRVMMPNSKMGKYFCYENGVKIKDDEGNKTYLETGVETKHNETSMFSGGIKGFLRKTAPNIAQLFFTRALTDNDFTENQKQVLFDVIQNAIGRGMNKDKGCVQYNDYSDEIKSQLDTGQGAGTIDTLLGTATDDKFRMATTLGRFCYEFKQDGSYIVTDKYDFSRARSYNITLDELKGKTYPQQLVYVMEKSDSTPYRAARQIAYLEHPDTAPESTKTPITIKIDSGYYASLNNKKSTTNTEIA